MTRIKIRDILNIIRLNTEPVCILIVHILSGDLLILEVELAGLIGAIGSFEVFEPLVESPNEVDGPLAVHLEVLLAELTFDPELHLGCCQGITAAVVQLANALDVEEVRDFLQTAFEAVERVHQDFQI